MTREELVVVVTSIIRDLLDDETLALTDSTVASDVPGWDSFNHIQIIVATEKRLGVRFRTHEIEGLANFGDFISLLSEKTNSI